MYCPGGIVKWDMILQGIMQSRIMFSPLEGRKEGDKTKVKFAMYGGSICRFFGCMGVSLS